MSYKLGSLFDGSGGFPLSGALCGIETVWAAEVEPYPIAVTRSRFPKMRHLGDISKIHGGEIEPVDIITFGSPCQDLSVAGKRAGLKHEANGDEETTRSGLFMEAVRIIKEMRAATNGKYPTFALWENVPGAFSSNKGEDFRIVCEELIKIIEPSASMPPVPKGGWPYADSYMLDGGSLAYRLFDAQYWGVPQRRRRIYLVADFRGERAREILFEREGLRGYFTQGRTPWQTTPADAESRTGADDCKGEIIDGTGGRQLDAVAVPYTLKIRGGVDVDSAGKSAGKGALIQTNLSATLGTAQDQYLFQPIDTHIIDNIGGQAEYAKATGINGTLRAGCQGAVAYVIENHSQDTRYNGNNQPFVMEPFCKSARAQTKDDATTWKHGKVANTLNTFDQGEARANELVVQSEPVICLQGNGIDRSDTAGCNGKGWKEDTSYTLNTIDRPAVVYAVDQGGGKSGANVSENMAPTLCTTHGGEPVIALDRASFNQGENAQYDFEITDSGVNSTLVARGPSAVAYGTDVGWLNSIENQSPTLLARSYKDPHLVTYSNVAHYIVRRLTPTECARLQGFADWWGIVEQKKDLTDEEYQFWLEVRNTHARINGKKVQDYTKKQMLNWYNKLYTDSAEYKMWGNGIALPTALYCIQGVADALNAPEDDDSWLM